MKNNTKTIKRSLLRETNNTLTSMNLRFYENEVPNLHAYYQCAGWVPNSTIGWVQCSQAEFLFICTTLAGVQFALYGKYSMKQSFDVEYVLAECDDIFKVESFVRQGCVCTLPYCIHRYEARKDRINARQCIAHNFCKTQGYQEFIVRLCSRAADFIPYDFYVKLIEDVLMLIYDLKRTPKADGSLDMRAVTMAAASFGNRRSDKSTLKRLAVDKIVKLFTSEFEVQGFEETIGLARECLDQYDAVLNSKMLKKIHNVAMYALSYSLFEPIGITMDSIGFGKLRQEAIKRKYYAGGDMVKCLLDTTLFVLERGYQFMKTGNMDSIFHSGKTYSEWMDKVHELIRKKDLLHNPEPFGFTECEYVNDLINTIEQGEHILKFATESKYEKDIVMRSLNTLKLHQGELLTRQYSRAQRDVPFSVLICGTSSIGKSTIKEMLFNHYADLQGRPKGDEYKYTRNPAAKFWDGFASSMWCIVMDDVAFVHPNKAPNGDPSIMEVIQVVNAVPFVPDQAALEDKGKTPVKAELVIATTNTEDLNAHYYFSCAPAVQRRFPYVIIPTVKKEFAGPGGSLVVKNEADEYPDYWEWTVKEVCPPDDVTKRQADSKIIMVKATLQEFQTWFAKAVKLHNANVKQVRKSAEVIKSAGICSKCNLVMPVCSCLKVQGAISDIAASVSMFLALPSFFNGICDLLLKWKMYCVLSYFNFVPSFEQQKAVLRNLGDRIHRRIGYPTMFAAIATLIVTGGIAYTTFKTVMTIQGAAQSIPKPMEKERTNVWVNNSFVATHLDYTPEITSSKGDSSFMGRISKNVHMFQIFFSENGVRKKSTGRVVNLVGQKFLTNNHLVPRSADRLQIKLIKQESADGVTTNFTTYVNECDIKRFPEHDLCIFTLPNVPAGKSIVKYFPKESMAAQFKGTVLRREENGSLTQLPVAKTASIGKMDLLNQKIDVWQYHGNFSLRDGDCGSLLVSHTQHGSCLLGLHIAKNDHFHVAIKVTQEKLHRMLGEEDQYAIQGGDIMLSSKSAKRSIGEVHHKSVFRYIESGVAQVAGSFVGHRAAGKTRVCASLLSSAFAAKGYALKYTAPVMRGWEPWRIAALDMVKPVIKLNSTVLRKASAGFLKDILSVMTSEMFELLTPYDLFTAVNGAAGVAYVDKINRNTSAGHPWNQSKRYFITAAPPANGLEDPVQVVSEIKDRVEIMEQACKNGQRAMPVFTAHLKDEPVTFAKKEQGKTRVFAGAPFDFTILMRKYYLPFIRLAQNHKYVFEAAPGMVCQSMEWEKLYHHLTQFGGDQIVAGDYKSFDKRMPPEIILEAFSIIHSLCAESGNYDEEDMRVLRAIAQDIAFPIINFNGDLVQFYGSNPSGHPLTVTINSLVNCLYMRYCYIMLNPEHEVDTFQDNVALMTYGDDNIMGVSTRAPWFNHTAIAKVLSDCDITYTMADKDAESKPYIDIREASFLKRTWRYDDDVGAILCPLEHDSIEKMLMIWVKSKTISAEEQSMAVIASAIREYFYYGKEIFEEKRELFKEVIEDENLTLYLQDSTLPSYDSLVKEFWKNSEYLL